MDREGEENLYASIKTQRKPRRERNDNLDRHLNEDLAGNPRVSIKMWEARQFKRGLQEDEEPFPVSPRVGPYEVKDVIFGAKNYFWCSCGMSKKQPFCDSSHVGTSFSPIKFSLDEKRDSMNLCGCKLSKNAPFCDGETCLKLLKGEEFE